MSVSLIKAAVGVAFLLLLASSTPVHAEPADRAAPSDLGALADGEVSTQLSGPTLSTRASTRATLLERIRRQGDDPARAFLPENPASPTELLVPELDPRDVDAILASILLGMERDDTDRILAVLNEIQPLKTETVGSNFGAVDELYHASTDLYSDPVKVLAKRPNLRLDRVDAADFDYPIVINRKVKNWMVYLLTRGRKYFVKWLARAERYEPLIVPRLEAAGLPRDLLYQAMIESGFNPYATSHASAVGVWQFIASTGRAYGLDRDWWIDERRDPVQATDSAIQFMSELYARFGTWEVASAAYNAGGGKLSKAIRMYESRDYWDLASSDRPYLAAETKNYVPKMIAAAILGKYADRYGLRSEIKDEHRLTPWDFDEVAVPEATDLRLVAKILGVEATEIEAINPALRRGFTPPGMANYLLNLPKGSAEAFEKEFAKLPRSERTTFVRHKIRRGETLGEIAEDYGVPSQTIAEVNKIKDPRNLKVGHRLLVPVRPEQIEARTVTHLVVRGDTLSTIAERYKVSVDQLKKRNSLKRDTIRLGQKLKIDVKGSSGTSRLSKSKGSKSKQSNGSKTSAKDTGPTARDGKKIGWHTVQSGESLYRIASRHGVSVDAIRTYNKLGKNSVIHPGDRLRVRPAPKFASYEVKQGDSVWGIATRHGMSVEEFRKLNGMKDNSIHPGQKLKVKGTATTAPSGGKKTTQASTHKVVAGDTLSEIAELYGIKLADLKRWNGIKGDRIRLGQVLRVASR